MKRWCKYCQTLTPPTPAHPGRPRACSICFHPYESEPAQIPPRTIEPSSKRSHKAAVVVATPQPTPEAQPVLKSPCFHLRDRNNWGTFQPTPHKRNACYARIRVQQRWWQPTASIVPTAIPKGHQARYCFADYTTCPYFLPAGTPPKLLRDDYESAG